VSAGFQALVTGGSSAIERSRQLVCSAFGARAATLTDSGTTALTLALLAAQLARSGPIALPAYGCFDLVTAVVGAGGRAVFYDLDPHSLQPERGSLSRALAAAPAALVVAHLFGIPMDLDAVAAGVRSQTVVVDDAAQAVGAFLRGAPAGSLGSFGVLSFGRGKGIAGTGGGALLAFTDEAAQLLRDVAGRLGAGSRGWLAWGKLVTQWALGRPSLYGIAAAMPFLHLGETRYRVPGPLHAISACAGGAVSACWERLAGESDQRRHHGMTLDSVARASAQVRRVVPPAGAIPGYLRYPVLSATLAAAVARFGSVRALGLERGYPHPLPQLAALQDRVLNPGERFPGASVLAEELVTLPTHRLVSEGDVRQLSTLLLAGPDRLTGVATAITG
jgi:dTDP-4-amino-4,6-dideoxygalactose transaminase